MVRSNNCYQLILNLLSELDDTPLAYASYLLGFIVTSLALSSNPIIRFTP